MGVMSVNAAFDNLRRHGIPADTIERLRLTARGDTPEAVLAHAGRGLILVADAPQDRVTIGQALLTEMSRLPLEPRVRDQVSTGLSLMGGETYDDLFIQRTTFCGVLDEEAAVLVPLPESRTILRLPVGAHDAAQAADNRRVVDDLQRRADAQRAIIDEVSPQVRDATEGAARNEQLERRCERGARIARGAAIASAAAAVVSTGAFVATGAALALSGISLGLGALSLSWLTESTLGTSGALKGMKASLLRSQARMGEWQLRDAERRLAEVDRDLSIARPRVEAYEAARREEEMARLARVASLPPADGRIETEAQWVTINGMRLPRRTAPAPQ